MSEGIIIRGTKVYKDWQSLVNELEAENKALRELEAENKRLRTTVEDYDATYDAVLKLLGR